MGRRAVVPVERARNRAFDIPSSWDETTTDRARALRSALVDMVLESVNAARPDRVTLSAEVSVPDLELLRRVLPYEAARHPYAPRVMVGRCSVSIHSGPHASPDAISFQGACGRRVRFLPPTTLAPEAAETYVVLRADGWSAEDAAEAASALAL